MADDATKLCIVPEVERRRTQREQEILALLDTLKDEVERGLVDGLLVVAERGGVTAFAYSGDGNRYERAGRLDALKMRLLGSA